MSLIIFELKCMLRRRFKNPISLVIEAAVSGGMLLLIEKVMSGMGGDLIASKQIMFIASILALPAIQGLHRLIAEETAYGTIEALFQVPGGPVRAFLARDMSSIVSVLLIMPLMAISLSRFSAFSPIVYLKYAIPILIMRCGLLGMGIILGAATLVFKRTAAVINISSIIMVVTSLGAGIGEGFLGRLASMSPHGLLAIQLQKGMQPADMLTGLIIVSVVWIGAGIGVYNLAVRRARRFGLLIGS